MVDRILRPVTRAAQSPHEEPGKIRSGHPESAEGRSGSWWGLLRFAMAVLGNARVQAPWNCDPLQYQPARKGRWRNVPCPFRHRARGQAQGDGKWAGGRKRTA